MKTARLSLLLIALALAGCTAAHYRKSADKESYRAVAEKSMLVTNMDERFSIERTNAVDLSALPVAAGANDFLGDAAASERGARVLSLEKALLVAVKSSRQYQYNKEQLYLAALSLTLTRHEFAPIFSAGGEARYEGQTEQTIALVPDPVTGQPIPVLSDDLVERHDLRLSGEARADWLIRDVGKLSAAVTTDFLRFLEGNPGTLISSQIGATFTRPLLRNANFKAEMEQLTQGERDLLYATRDFVKYRKDFSVQVASAYYGALENRDAARNAYLNLQSSKKSGERTRALAAEGRTTQSDLGRIEQQENSSEASWVSAVRTYQRALDNFKFLLGLNIESRIVLDDSELEQLKIRNPKIELEDAIQVALVARLDYQNSKDQVADSDRKIDLAKNRFLPQLDFVADAGFSSPPGQTHGFAVPDIRRYYWGAGANLDLPLERKAERNDYRAALIARDRAKDAELSQRDQIELQIRDSWRTLEQARRNFELSEIAVNLADRRVEEQDLLAEFGRAKALDQVDAQNALVTSKDQRTAALVAHTIARLQFWDNMGILYIKENGQWQEVE